MSESRQGALESSTKDRRRLSTRDIVLLGAATVGGWVLNDLARFVATAQPELALHLVPSWLAAMGIGALVGLGLALWPRLLHLVMAASLLASVAPELFPVPWDGPLLWLPRAVLLMSVAAAAAMGLARRAGLGSLRTGIGLGLLLSLVMCVYREELAAEGWRSPSQIRTLLLVLAGAALLGLGAAFVRSRVARAALTLVAVAVPTLVVGMTAWRETRLPRPDLAATRPQGSGPHLVLIVLDSVRAERLAPYGYHRVTTPGLDEFVRNRATLYTRARSTSSWTLPAHASLFTGLFPSEHGAAHPRGADRESVSVAGRKVATPLRKDIPTLAERLAAAGYRTAAISANSAYVRHEFGLDRGFQHFDDRPGSSVGEHLALAQLVRQQMDKGHAYYRPAEAITDLAIRWIDTRRQAGPFFLFLNYMDAHWPYLPPAELDGAFEDARPTNPLWPEKELWSLLYDRELLYMDRHLRRLLQALEERGLMDDSVVMITSDHGEAFGEHGFWRHDKTLYDEVLRIPLYVKSAGTKPPGTRNDPLTIADVFHLAMGELGLGESSSLLAGGFVGEWFRFADNRRGLDRDLVSWVDGCRKFIVSSAGQVDAFDLERDPGESEPLALSDAEIGSALERAHAWWESHPPVGEVSVTLDEDALERLHSLGYIGDGE